LVELYQSFNENITDACISNLVGLTNLDPGFESNKITDAGISCLTNLIDLNLGYNTLISDAGLADLKKLADLSLDRTDNSNITVAGLTALCTLSNLCVSARSVIKEVDVPNSILVYYNSDYD
jgi:hypothetical protein